jgi:hypothetical protein
MDLAVNVLISRLTFQLIHYSEDFMIYKSMFLSSFLASFLFANDAELKIKQLREELLKKELELSKLGKKIEKKEKLLIKMARSVSKIYNNLSKEESQKIREEVAQFLKRFDEISTAICFAHRAGEIRKIAHARKS